MKLMATSVPRWLRCERKLELVELGVEQNKFRGGVTTEIIFGKLCEKI